MRGKEKKGEKLRDTQIPNDIKNRSLIIRTGGGVGERDFRLKTTRSLKKLKNRAFLTLLLTKTLRNI